MGGLKWLGFEGKGGCGGTGDGWFGKLWVGDFNCYDLFLNARLWTAMAKVIPIEPPRQYPAPSQTEVMSGSFLKSTMLVSPIRAEVIAAVKYCPVLMFLELNPSRNTFEIVARKIRAAEFI